MTNKQVFFREPNICDHNAEICLWHSKQPGAILGQYFSFTTSFTLWTWNLWPCLSWNFCLIKLTIQSYSSTIFYAPIGCYSDSLPDYHNKSCWSTKFHLKICMIQYIVFPELNLLIKCLFFKGIFFNSFFFLWSNALCVLFPSKWSMMLASYSAYKLMKLILQMDVLSTI